MCRFDVFPVCLISFIGCRYARSPDAVSSLVSSCASRGASRSSSRFIVSSRIACSFRSSHLRIPGGVPFYSVPLSLRLVISSCRSVLLARLVSFSFVLLPCGYVMRRSCVGGCSHIIQMGVRLVRLLLARPDGVGGIRCPARVIWS